MHLAGTSSYSLLFSLVWTGPNITINIACIKLPLFWNTKLLSSGRWSFLAVSAAGHAGGLPVHEGASAGPGRAPWHVLWAFEVAEFWQVTTGSLSAEPEPSKTIENPNISLFAPRATYGRTLASRFPRSCSDGHCSACADQYYACVDIAYAYVCCVCATCGCVCVCAGLCVCVLAPHISAF